MLLLISSITLAWHDLGCLCSCSRAKPPGIPMQASGCVQLWVALAAHALGWRMAHLGPLQTATTCHVHDSAQATPASSTATTLPWSVRIRGQRLLRLLLGGSKRVVLQANSTHGTSAVSQHLDVTGRALSTEPVSGYKPLDCAFDWIASSPEEFLTSPTLGCEFGAGGSRGREHVLQRLAGRYADDLGHHYWTQILVTRARSSVSMPHKRVRCAYDGMGVGQASGFPWRQCDEVPVPDPCVWTALRPHQQQGHVHAVWDQYVGCSM